LQTIAKPDINVIA